LRNLRNFLAWLDLIENIFYLRGKIQLLRDKRATTKHKDTKDKAEEVEEMEKKAQAKFKVWNLKR